MDDSVRARCRLAGAPQHGTATPFHCPVPGCTKRFKWRSSLLHHFHSRAHATLPGWPGASAPEEAPQAPGAGDGTANGYVNGYG